MSTRPEMVSRQRSFLRRLFSMLAGKTLRASEIVYSAVYVTPVGRWLRDRTFRHRAPPASVRPAMVAHVFYLDLWDEIIDAWATMPPGAPLIVTTPPETAEDVCRLAAFSSLIDVHVVPNRGRDIAPFMRLLNDGVLVPYDAVLKLHTKKSSHMSLVWLRRRLIYTALAGSAANVSRILHHFQDPSTGLVGQRWFFRTRPVFWMNNRALVTALCHRMTPPAPLRLGFFEGTMFWVRPAALAPLKRLGLGMDDFESEAGQVDGTLHHSVERVMTLAALAEGYCVRSLDGTVLMIPDVKTP